MSRRGERAPQHADGLAHEPVRLMALEGGIGGEHVRRLARSLENPGADFELIGAQDSPAHQRARNRHLATQDPRRHRQRARRGRRSGQAPRPLVRARDAGPVAAHPGAAGCLLAHPLSRSSTRLLLRRHAGASSRSPPTAATCSQLPDDRTERRTVALDALTSAPTRRSPPSRGWPRAFLGGAGRGGAPEPLKGEPLTRRRRRKTRAWSPSPRTIWTGTTKCASRWKSAPACRPTR